MYVLTRFTTVYYFVLYLHYTLYTAFKSMPKFCFLLVHFLQLVICRIRRLLSAVRQTMGAVVLKPNVVKRSKAKSLVPVGRDTPEMDARAQVYLNFLSIYSATFAYSVYKEQSLTGSEIFFHRQKN